MIDIITCTRFIMQAMHVFHRIFFSLFLEIGEHLGIALVFENFVPFFLIIFFWVLDIVDAIFLPCLVKTKEAITASGASVTKCQIMRILTISAKGEMMTLLTIIAFIAVLGVWYNLSIKTTLTMKCITHIVTIFQIIYIKTQITIFEMSGTVIKFWILKMQYREWQQGSCLHEIGKLIKKWPFKIRCAGIVSKSPIIAPPSLWSIDRVG